MQLQTGPPPGIKEAYMATKLKAKNGENDLQKEAHLTEKERKRLEKEQQMFRKAHPDLFQEEETAVGQMLRINGELADEGRKKKKAFAWIYEAVLWVKRWWLLTLFLAVVISCFVRLPYPVHRKLPAVRFDSNGTATEVMEIDGVMWQCFALRPHFVGTIRTSQYEVKVKGSFSDQFGVNPERYFYPYGDYSQTPKEFQEVWLPNTIRNRPFVKNRFQRVVLHNHGTYLLAPATDPEEAKEILNKEYATAIP